MWIERWRFHLPVAALAIIAMTLALTPAVADPLDGADQYPKVAFLARNDVPFDAQTAAAVAAQLGAPIFITNPNALSDAAAKGIADLDPDVLIVAGGPFAIADTVATAAAQQCSPACEVDRRFGTGRDETAAALAGIAADYGFDRPVLQGSNQVVGDVFVGGTVNADAITVQDTARVSGLNADRVDGIDGDEMLRFPVVTRGFGDPRPGYSSTLVTRHFGHYVEFSSEDFDSTTAVFFIFLDIPGPASSGGQTLELVALELCYRLNATDSGIVGAEVRQKEAHASPTSSWTTDLGYNADASPQCVDLGNPPVPHTGPATLRLRWEESESLPVSLQIHGLSATWDLAG